MKTFTKLLVASVLAVSFAAPVVAGEEATLAERNVYANPQPTQAYAMAPAMTPTKFKHAKSGWSHTKDQSIASQ